MDGNILLNLKEIIISLKTIAR